MSQRDVWDAIAPSWAERRKQSWPETEAFLKSQKGLVLDHGCGSGRNFQKGGKIVGIDFSKQQLLGAKEMLAERKLEAHLVCGEIKKLPFSNGTFDAGMSISVIQCVKGSANRKKALEELNRVLKKDSEVMITVWNRDQPRFKGRKEGLIPWNFDGRTYMRYYYLFDEKELRKALENAGFEVLSLQGSALRAHRIFPRNIVAVVKKA